MTGLSNLSRLICYVCVAVSVVSVIIPQKRTRKIMSFVIGLFLISTVVGGITAQSDILRFDAAALDQMTIPEHSEQEYIDTVAQRTAENLAASLNELLLEEEITADDIQITLKISDAGRIYASRVVIYINEAYANRIGEIESIIYRNVSKEPEIYVAGQKVV